MDESAYYRYTNKEIVEEISALVCAAQTIQQPTLSLMISLLTLTGDVAREEPFRWVAPLRKELLPQWRSRLEAVLERAPYRTDLLAPYFRWQFKQNNRQDVWNWCQKILTEYPNDAIALWFKGTILKESPRYRRIAYTFLNRALDAGVSRIIPIDPELEKTIKSLQKQ